MSIILYYTLYVLTLKYCEKICVYVCTYVYVCLRLCACVCVCVCAAERAHQEESRPCCMSLYQQWFISLCP